IRLRKPVATGLCRNRFETVGPDSIRFTTGSKKWNRFRPLDGLHTINKFQLKKKIFFLLKTFNFFCIIPFKFILLYLYDYYSKKIENYKCGVNKSYRCVT